MTTAEPTGAPSGPSAVGATSGERAATLPAPPAEDGVLAVAAPAPRIDPRRLARHRVTAVMVTHDGANWVEHALRSVLDQDRPVDRLHVVDTGSDDDTVDIARRVLGRDIHRLSRTTGFGSAVAQVLAVDAADRAAGADAAGSGAEAEGTGPGTGAEDTRADDTDTDTGTEGTDTGAGVLGEPVDWVWLLHDDCAPDPDALRRLLTAVDDQPSVGVAGPKVLGWAEPRHLLEVGVTIARGGQRETGLERAEQDQGQHDQQRDVLAVSTAGMLIRRDVWDEVGGLDPWFTLFRDDVDLGWRVNAAGYRVVVVPDAVVHHAEAATHRRRRISTGPDRPHRLDRLHAMTVLAANVSTLALPFLLVRLVLGTLGRTVGFLVGKAPDLALAELRALAAFLRSPGTLRRARRARRATRRVPHRETSRLLAPRGTQLRHALDVASSVFSSRTTAPARLGAATAGLDEDDEDGPDFLTDADSVLRRALRRPGVVLVLVTAVIALVAQRALIGSGDLVGGRLLPAPDGASELWATYTAAWNPVGLGSTEPAEGYVAVLAVVASVLLGKVWVVVDVLVLLAVPLAAAAAYVASRRVVRSLTLRLWASATYAVLPVATGAVAGGRLGTLLLLVLLPVVAGPALRLARVLDPEPTWRTAWGNGLLLALLVAFVPPVWVLAVALAAVAAVTTARTSTDRLRLAAAVLVPLVVLVPWSLQLLTDPSRLLVEAGVPSSSVVDLDPHPFGVLALAPGGPGTPPWWVGVGVVLAAVAAVVALAPRRRRRRVVDVAWVVAAVSLGLGALVAGVTVDEPGSGTALPAWPGPFVLVGSAALLVAAVAGAQGARHRLARASFGWRQPIVAVVAVLGVLGPLTAVATWVVDGAGEPLRRVGTDQLPAFVAADLTSPERPRALVLGQRGTGLVPFQLVRDDGVHLGDGAVVEDAPEQLADLVADVASGRGGGTAPAFARYGVRYVVLAAPVPEDLARSLDGATGLRRAATNEAGAVWRVAGDIGRVRLVPEEGAASLLASGAGTRVEADLPADAPAGRVELAERADGAWKATLGGLPLQGEARDGWQQSFVLPEGGGRLVIDHEGSGRGRWLVVQAVLLLVVVVLASPGRRRDGEGEDA